MQRAETIAVLDIGKTNAKLVLVDGGTGAEIALRTMANRIHTDGPYPHFDVDGIWAFFRDALHELHREHPIGAISITTHGAAAALLGSEDGDGLAMPILDYEHAGPDELAAEYAAVRPAFAETRSARLPGGLNLGAQLFWQQHRFPREFGNVRSFLTYPQYWAWRLTGRAATECTSLGCHTDLWNVQTGDWSSLVRRMGWGDLMAPLRSAFDAMGPLRPELARELGLSRDLPVACGIHDSNASLLPHLIRHEKPFSVISTGTWVVIFAPGGGMEHLDEHRDGLANVDAFGTPVPCARFMGGREFEQLTGNKAMAAEPGALEAVVSRGIMALPSFCRGTGPFPGQSGTWSLDPGQLTPDERVAAASLYAALVTEEAMRIADASGPIIVEGPFAANATYCGALAALTRRPVIRSAGQTGTCFGAALLIDRSILERHAAASTEKPVPPLEIAGLNAYARDWRARIAARRPIAVTA
ncbi:Sugar (pentulose or hexulose) kinase [Faunimonas pinastri]|uniref:Sugar (Pentulose or hexulose) kinase n=1 Tax=Faunimonas pinastri TaxID=1855383 RepID=A0A1H9NV91_9HYPH|nr:FGGY-family carbohydrate kinase [Faunimonas pinastri]SER39509.1 Sugar (pentulose or hexulose) kinase [Faunimonas pinastri]